MVTIEGWIIITDALMAYWHILIKSIKFFNMIEEFNQTKEFDTG